jgi:hypothetical protein
VLLIQRDSICGFIATICLCTKFPADCDLGGESDNSNPDIVGEQGTYRLMNVSRVGGKKGPKYD